MRKFFFVFSLVIFVFGISLFFWPLSSSKVKRELKSSQLEVKKNSNIPIKRKLVDTTFRVKWKNSAIEVYFRASKRDTILGTILVLPGWNHSVLRWCSEMKFCEKACSEGYQLVMPEMKKSTYTRKYFPESRKDMVDSPLLTWLSDTVLPFFQTNYNAFIKGGENYVIGLSTGARGAVLMAMECEGVFKKGVAYSGDFDNSRLSKDKVMNIFYGSYSKFKERWLTESNPAAMINKLKTPFFFIHGKEDKVVDYSNSVEFYQLIDRETKNHQHQLYILENQAHTYPFWDSQTDTALYFFKAQ